MVGDSEPFPGHVSFDLRVTVPPDEFPVAVKRVERMARRRGWDIDYLPGERLPYLQIPSTVAEALGLDEPE